VRRLMRGVSDGPGQGSARYPSGYSHSATKAHRLQSAVGRASEAYVPVSLKVRVTSGCFHRQHSPHAYALIDRDIGALTRDPALSFVEHENGPELLVE
jgi:hypothetical protein